MARGERGEQAERDFDLPVLELVVTHEQDPELLYVKSTKPVAGRRKGWRPSYNWPPLTRREIAASLLRCRLLGDAEVALALVLA